MTGGAPGSGGGAHGGTAPTGGTGGLDLGGTGGEVNTGGSPGTGGSGAGGSGAGGGTTGRCGLAGSAKALEACGTFKDVTVTSDGAGDYLRVFKPDSGSVIGSTVSEGMGYGPTTDSSPPGPTRRVSPWKPT